MTEFNKKLEIKGKKNHYRKTTPAGTVEQTDIIEGKKYNLKIRKKWRKK